MILITAISFAVAALVLVVAYIASMVKMLRNSDETEQFALILFWLIGGDE